MKKSFKYPFEYNVLVLACTLGLIRSFLAVVGDLEDINQHPDFITDVLFTLVFAYGLIAVNTNTSFRWILIFFFSPLVVLFIYTFYQAGGLEKGIEHNIFAGLIFLNFTLRDKLPIYFSLILIFGVMASLFILSYEMVVFQNNHISDLNFIFATLGIIGLTYYAKYVFSKRRDRLKMNRLNLEDKSRLLKENQEKLIEQKKALEELALVLDKKVTEKTNALKKQKQRREKYLSLTSNELSISIDGTLELVEDLKGKYENEALVGMMAESGNNLKKQIELLNKKVDGHS